MPVNVVVACCYSQFSLPTHVDIDVNVDPMLFLSCIYRKTSIGEDLVAYLHEEYPVRCDETNCVSKWSSVCYGNRGRQRGT